MKIAAWISVVIALVMIAFAAIAFFFVSNLFGVNHPYNFVFVAMAFLLLGIFLVLQEGCCCHKDKK